MIMLKSIHNRHFRELIKLQNPTSSSDFSFLSSISRKRFSIGAQCAAKSDHNVTVSVSESIKNGGVEAEISGIAESEEKLRNVENGGKVNLSALFAETKMKRVRSVKPKTVCRNDDPMAYKELSHDMQMFAYHLYVEGYLKDASLMPKNEFDVAYFKCSRGHEVLKSAAWKFGGDHQEIVKLLSAGDLKNVALFGCPSLDHRSVYAAKDMRRFFEIEEQKVCDKCTLKGSCKRENKNKGGYKPLDLAKVTRNLVIYALESVPPQLVVPEEVNNSISRLLKEIIKFSQATTLTLP